MKRRICIWKSRKETRARAIEELNDYLKIFMADTTAWQELGDLYLDDQQYASELRFLCAHHMVLILTSLRSFYRYEYAGFCYEELILAEPLNHYYHNRYAEVCPEWRSTSVRRSPQDPLSVLQILYTLGDYATARKYFAHSLELNQENNNRALFGLALVSIHGTVLACTYSVITLVMGADVQGIGIEEGRQIQGKWRLGQSGISKAASKLQETGTSMFAACFFRPNQDASGIKASFANNGVTCVHKVSLGMSGACDDSQKITRGETLKGSDRLSHNHDRAVRVVDDKFGHRP